MLSSVLNSKTALEINRGIMRAFVAVRQLVLSPPIDEVKTENHSDDRKRSFGCLQTIIRMIEIKHPDVFS